MFQVNKITENITWTFQASNINSWFLANFQSSETLSATLNWYGNIWKIKFCNKNLIKLRPSADGSFDALIDFFWTQLDLTRRSDVNDVAVKRWRWLRLGLSPFFTAGSSRSQKKKCRVPHELPLCKKLRHYARRNKENVKNKIFRGRRCRMRNYWPGVMQWSIIHSSVSVCSVCGFSEME